MKDKYAIMVVLALTALALLTAHSQAAIYCDFNASTTCDAGLKFVGIENDTGGFNNAHVQNYSLNTYANSLCCSTNVTDDSIGRDCSDVVLFNMSSQDNAHVQNNSIGTYPVGVCLSLDNSNLSCRYDSSCGASETCLFSMSSEDNAHIGDCSEYSILYCCSVSSGPPPVPTLLLPVDNNYSVQERYVFFDWTDSIDPQGDPVHYTINITAPSGCAAIGAINRSVSDYTSTTQLCTDATYNWTVRACDDGELCSAWAPQANFSIESLILINFTTNSTDFGTVEPSTIDTTVENDTLDNDPSPLVIENVGNVNVDVELYGLSQLWTNQPLNTSYFQFRNESASVWSNVNTNYTNFTRFLNFSDSEELELRIEVPIGEPPGAKSIVLQARAGASS